MFDIDGEQPVFYTTGDEAMDNAHKQAQDTFRFFWREMTWEGRRIIPGLDVASVKVAFTDPDDQANAEHMWVGDVRFDGASVSGTLLNSPNHLQSVTAGDQVVIGLNHISDWMYATSGRAYGGYTVNLLRSRMEADELKGHDAAWGLDFGDPNNVLVVYDYNPAVKKAGWFGRKNASSEGEGSSPCCTTWRWPEAQLLSTSCSSTVLTEQPSRRTA